MKTLSIAIKVEVDDGVTEKMIRDILLNHLYFAFRETDGGNVYWERTKFFIGDESRWLKMGEHPGSVEGTA